MRKPDHRVFSLKVSDRPLPRSLPYLSAITDQEPCRSQKRHQHAGPRVRLGPVGASTTRARSPHGFVRVRPTRCPADTRSLFLIRLSMSAYAYRGSSPVGGEILRQAAGRLERRTIHLRMTNRGTSVSGFRKELARISRLTTCGCISRTTPLTTTTHGKNGCESTVRGGKDSHGRWTRRGWRKPARTRRRAACVW